jgi:hypothetical protein
MVRLIIPRQGSNAALGCQIRIDTSDHEGLAPHDAKIKSYGHQSTPGENERMETVFPAHGANV